MNRTKQVIRLLAAALVIAMLLPGIAGAEEAASQDSPAKVAIRVDGAGKGVTEVAATLLPGDSVRVELTASSGTGYSWQMEGAPALVTVEKSGPQPLRSAEGLVGGPYREVYVLRAGETAGSETVRFVLARPWEDKNRAVKSLAISVTVKQREE